MLTRTWMALLAALALAVAPDAGAQAAPADPSARLRVVLPPEVAERVLATIADARARDLPADALAQRALKFAARGVSPDDIATAVTEHANRLGASRTALQRGRPTLPTPPAPDEIEAGAEVLRRGVSGEQVSALARSAPSGRSVAVPLYVIGSLLDRGLPSDDALRRVQERLAMRAADAELERLSADEGAHSGKGKGRPAQTGRDLARTRQPGSPGGERGASGRPAGVPANTGKENRPPTAGRPENPGQSSNAAGQGRP